MFTKTRTNAILHRYLPGRSSSCPYLCNEVAFPRIMRGLCVHVCPRVCVLSVAPQGELSAGTWVTGRVSEEVYGSRRGFPQNDKFIPGREQIFLLTDRNTKRAYHLSAYVFNNYIRITFIYFITSLFTFISLHFTLHSSALLLYLIFISFRFALPSPLFPPFPFFSLSSCE